MNNNIIETVYTHFEIESLSSLRLSTEPTPGGSAVNWPTGGAVLYPPASARAILVSWKGIISKRNTMLATRATERSGVFYKQPSVKHDIFYFTFLHFLDTFPAARIS